MDLDKFSGDRDKVLLEKFTKNGEWDLGMTEAAYKEYYLDGIPVPFSMVRFTIELKRKVCTTCLNI